MKPGSLIASATINFGLALIVLSLFSIFKKQPSNAPIYYARRLSKRHHIPFDHSFTFSRFIPSVSWIPRAFRVTEDEILQISGLDALIIIRLFKFGINFFAVCSLIGLVILLPINYGGQDEPSRVSLSMDSFTISNVIRGSNRLWVHFTCLCFVSFYGLYLLYKEYDAILVKRIQRLRDLRHRPDQFTVLVRQIPLCLEHKGYDCSVDHFFSKYYPKSYHSHQMLYDGKEIENRLAKCVTKKIEELRGRSTVKKHGKECLLNDSTTGEDFLKITLLEEKVQEIFHEIRQIQGEHMLKGKELPVAFATFKSRCGAALAAQSQQNSHPLIMITEMAPQPKDVSWRSLAIPLKFMPLYKIGIIVLASLLTIFFAVPVTAVQGIAKFEKLKKWFPPAMAIELIPGVSSILTGFLPSAVLRGFLYIVPLAMLGIAQRGGSISKSKAEIEACNMVFYFLVGNVFFLSLISGSLLDEIGEYVSHPKNYPSHLASAVSAQADFFMTYILTDGLSGFSLEILQPALFLWDSIVLHTCGRGKDENPYLYSLPYYRIIPSVSLSILIGMVYAVVSPFLLPLLVGYFCLGYMVYVNQIEDVYETVYETCGRYWPYIHHYIFIAIILMQITMIGLFGLKSKPAASIATIPLLLMTIAFNEYCKIRFLPTFCHYSIQDASKHDELDQKNGQLKVNYEQASNAYRPPSLQPVTLTVSSLQI
ncbi:CSC1-like protein At3g54510 isoform X2 [Hevea brasiliensis]|uniref:CSC1-like protein At3g54510 isoform X2 n=1 Tax=Hevea brasiliensis TaxID=3981 RepID=UPI0025EC07ED|nr:CSC1-like protein At3g54510 isoform X2 [Hevea brasiliensis]